MTEILDPPVTHQGEEGMDDAFLEIEMLDSGVGVGRPGRLRGVRDVFRGWGELRHTPYGLTPAVALSSLVGFQILQSEAFNFAGPTFVREGIKVTQIIGVLSVVGFIALFLNLIVGYLLERHKRVPILLGGSLAAGVAAAFSGYPTTTGGLGAVQGVAGGVGSASQVPSFSLIADYYPPETRGRVFSLLAAFQTGAQLVAVPAAAAGLIYLGLNKTFLISGALIVAASIAGMFVLREPIRGFFERRSTGLSDEESRTEDEPLSFGEAARTIFAVQTVRRFFAANVVGGLGSASSLYILFILVEKYGLSTWGLAFFTLPSLVVSVIASAIGGQYTDRLIGRNPARALTMFGLFGLVGAAGTFLFAVAPPLWLLVLFRVMVSAGDAFIGPAQSSLTTQVIPPNSRTLGLQFFHLAEAFKFLIFVNLLGLIFNAYGYSAVFVVGGISSVLSAAIVVSIGGLFDVDRRNALASASAGQKWEIARRAGSAQLLVCDKVDVAYDGVQTLFGVDFTVDEGECVALLGTNGAGKSTLLRAIAGIQEASGGAIVVSGRDITHMPPHEIAHRNVVFMPGGRGVFPDLSVKDNLLLAANSLEPEEVPALLAQVLEMFPALTRRYDAPAGVLSGGEQQQVALAQAFLQKPKLLMIDELSLGLAPAVVGELIEVVKRINASGIAVIVVEQSVTVALELAKRAVYMEKGRIRFDGAIPELMRRPDILRAIYVTGGATAGAPVQRGAARTAPVAIDHSERKVVLEAKGISKSFGGVLAVNNIDLPLYDGQVLGLIGPNGSGKTTLFDMISGFIPPTDGAVLLRGEDITDLSPDQRARKGLVRRFQDARLFPSLTVTETILIALEAQYAVKNPLLNGAGTPGSRRAERKARQRTDQLLALLELGGYRDTLAGELSTGLRRIVDLACVLASEPQVLLMDEPSTGVAQAEAEGLAPLLRRVQRETGCSILIIEHDMGLLKAVADEFAALNLGSLIARGTPEAVLTDPTVLEAYLGTNEAATNRSGGSK